METRLVLVLVVFCTPVLCETVYKKWRQNSNFENGENWAGGRVPCSRDRAVFPPSTPPVYVQTNASFMDLVLPVNGELVLGSYVTLAAAPSQQDAGDVNCTGSDVLFSGTQAADWFDGANWCEVTGPEGDCRSSPPARLDTERVPCIHDNVIFPAQATYQVSLASDVDIIVGRLSVEGQDYTTGSFRRFLSSTQGSKLFTRSDGGQATTVNILGGDCTALSGCECRTQTEVNEKICAHQEPRCAVVACHMPIKPKGQCCAVCGASLELTGAPGYSYSTLQGLVDNMRRDYDKPVRTIVSKIGMDLVQVVVTDEGSGEQAATLADRIKQTLTDDASGVNKYRVSQVTMTGESTSGNTAKQTGERPGGSGWSGGSIAAMVMAGFLVFAVVAGAVYCMAGRNPCRRPNFNIPDSWHRFGFKRRNNSQMELTPTVPFKESVYFTDITRGFDNPMYETGAQQKAPVAAAGASKSDGPAILDSTDVTFTSLAGPDPNAFANPLYITQPQTPTEGGACDELPSSPTVDTRSEENVAFTNPLYGAQNIAPGGSLHLNPVFSEEGVHHDSTV